MSAIPDRLKISVCSRCGEAGIDYDDDWAMDGHCEDVAEEREEEGDDDHDPRVDVVWVEYVRKDLLDGLLYQWEQDADGTLSVETLGQAAKAVRAVLS